jgi:hypothetical protein
LRLGLPELLGCFAKDALETASQMTLIAKTNPNSNLYNAQIAGLQ